MLCKKAFPKISQNSQGNICARVSTTVKNLQAVMLATLSKRGPRTGVSEQAVRRCSTK